MAPVQDTGYNVNSESGALRTVHTRTEPPKLGLLGNLGPHHCFSSVQTTPHPRVPRPLSPERTEGCANRSLKSETYIQANMRQ